MITNNKVGFADDLIKRINAVNAVAEVEKVYPASIWHVPEECRWISCLDELPRPFERVMCLVFEGDKKQINVGKMDDRGIWTDTEFACFPMDPAPLYWMRFPQAPDLPDYTQMKERPVNEL